jgi:Ca2+-binding EF-hand superfamily protein
MFLLVSSYILPIQYSLYFSGTPEEFDRLQKGWQKLQADAGSGPKPKPVTQAVFIREVLGTSVPTQIAQQIFKSFDRSRKGHLLFNDYICGMTLLLKGKPEEKMQFLFEIYDTARNGMITKDSFTQILKEDGLDDEKLLTTVVLACFEKHDKRGTGFIRFQDLEQWAYENKNLTGLLRWIFQNQGFAPNLPDDSLESPITEDNIDLLKSSEVRRANLRSSKELSSFTAFSKREVDQLEVHCKALQRSSPSWKIDKPALGSLFSPALDEQFLDQIFRYFDVNIDGYIDNREFVVGLSTLCRSSHYADCKCHVITNCTKKYFEFQNSIFMMIDFFDLL